MTLCYMKLQIKVVLSDKTSILNGCDYSCHIEINDIHVHVIDSYNKARFNNEIKNLKKK